MIYTTNYIPNDTNIYIVVVLYYSGGLKMTKNKTEQFAIKLHEFVEEEAKGLTTNDVVGTLEVLKWFLIDEVQKKAVTSEIGSAIESFRKEWKL